MVPIPRVEARTVDVPGGTLHFVEAGSGDPLILLHGGHGSWTHWVANIDALASTRRVLALDQPGFGQSFNPDPPFEIPGYAATVCALMDALALERVAVAGFSFGCTIAAATAAREPVRVTHLLMANPPGIGERNPEVPALQREHSRIAKEHGLRQGLVAGMKDLQLHNHDLIDDDLIALGMRNVRRTRRITRDVSRNSGMPELLAQVRQPTLVLMGAHDRHQQYRLDERLAIIRAASPHACVEQVERSAHWLPYDRADVFNERLSAFIG